MRSGWKVERFIKIGKEGEVVLPKDMYDVDGNLSCYPVVDEHIRSLRTKAQKGALPKLFDQANNNHRKGTGGEEEAERDCKKKSKQPSSPMDLLLSYVEEIVQSASKNGDGSISPRSLRKL
jgi:hypothetical protein